MEDRYMLSFREARRVVGLIAAQPLAQHKLTFVPLHQGSNQRPCSWLSVTQNDSFISF